MDNPSSLLTIALQHSDLDEFEVSGTMDKVVIHLQREQPETDSGFDVVNS